MSVLTFGATGRADRVLVTYDQSLAGDSFAKVREAMARARATLHKGAFLIKTQEVPFLTDLLEQLGVSYTINPSIQAELERAEEVTQVVVDDVEERIAESMAKLRPYQPVDVATLRRNKRWGLFLDMGLGKTPISLLALPVAARVVVVCPQSLQLNWKEEILKWRPDFKIVVISGRKAFRWPSEGEIVIVSFDSIPAEIAKKNDQGERYIKGWEAPPIPDGMTDMYLIVDEAHKLKNATSDRTKAYNETLKKRVGQADGYIWLLTGTEMRNGPHELWNVLKAADLHIKAFGSWPRFCEAFNMVFDPSRKQWRVKAGADGKPVPPQPWVIERLRSVSTKRLRKDHLKDLPPVVFRDIEVRIDQETLRLCDEVVAHLESQGIDLRNLTATVVATQFRGATLQLWSKARAALCAAKMKAALDIIADYEEQGVQLVVFSAHRAPAEILAKRSGWVTILGGQSAKQKIDSKNSLQSGVAKGIAGTYGAMSEGYTMTRAWNMLCVDMDPVPDTNSQAIARLQRYGQEAEKIQLNRLIANHKLDHRVVEICTDKQAIIDGSVNAAAVVEEDVQEPTYVDPPEQREAKRERRQFRTAQEKRAADALIAGLHNGAGNPLALKLFSGQGLTEEEWVLAVRALAQGRRGGYDGPEEGHEGEESGVEID